MSDERAPLAFRWLSGENDSAGARFIPLIGRHREKALAQYEDGKVYRLVEMHDRSRASHNHQFAWLTEAWSNLPDHLAASYPTDVHLRKHALIQTGFLHRLVIVCASEEDADRLLRHLAAEDTYAVVTRDGAMVIKLTAQSQSLKAMGNKVFQESKTKVLEYVAHLIGTTPETLRRNAGKSA